MILAVGGLIGSVVMVVAATLLGAWAERQGIPIVLDAAADDGLKLQATTLDGAPGTGRVALIRLLALVPVVAAAWLAGGAVYDAAYHELVLPRDLVTPLPLRVLAQVPWPVLGVSLTWLIADAAAALGVRRLVLDRRPVPAAWLLGWADLVRRPHRVIATALLGAGVLLALLGPSMVAAAIGWGRVRDILEAGRDPVTVVAATLVWVAIWLGGLVLAGVGAAVRAAAWTLEVPVQTVPAKESSPG